MSILDPLCQLPPEPPPGCCKAVPPVVVVPAEPFNSPGLPAIRYRIGNFASFRRAMLNRITKLDRMPGAVNPFANWREGTDGDYQTMFIEIWAYLADILTFYQERIANEAFLPTATQRDSMARLAALVNYRPSPGCGASGLVAFTVEKNKTITIPVGFRVGSKAQPPADGKAGKPAAIFETETAILAPGASSAIPVSTVAPTNQFAHLDSLGTLFGPLFVDQGFLAATAADLYGSTGSIFASTFFGQASAFQFAEVDPFFETGSVLPLDDLAQAVATRVVDRVDATAANFGAPQPVGETPLDCWQMRHLSNVPVGVVA